MTNELKKIYQKLDSLDIDVIESALDELGALNLQPALDILAKYLSNTHPEIRETAACNLGVIKNPGAIPYLIEAARFDKSEKVRAEALSALQNYYDEEIKSCFLDEVYRDKKSRRPRQIVAYGLRKYNDGRVVDALVELLNDNDVFVRDDAAESLFLLNRPELKRVWEKIVNDPDEYEQMKELALDALKNIEL